MKTKRRPRVAAIQMKCRHSMSVNVDYAIQEIAAAASEGANVIVLQEMFAHVYPCQSEDHRHFDFAQTIPGPISEQLQAAAKMHKVVIVGSIFEKRAAGLYHNSAIVIDADGTQKGMYRKMHIPDDPNFYEKFYFTPGDLGFQAIETSCGTIGVLICWDQWFPEAARITAMKGAEILVYPTAIGWMEEEKDEYGDSQCEAWETMMRSHAIANGIFVVATNRMGVEDNIEFWGNSFIADPNGSVIAKANHCDEQTIVAECDLDSIDVVRTVWPFLRDRRIDAYEGLLQRYLDNSGH